MWSRKNQASLSRGYERVAQNLKETTISGCYFSFILTIENQGDKDLRFEPGKVSVPVYAGETFMLTGHPYPKDGQAISLPAKSTKDIEFRGSIDNTRALGLIQFMRGGTPEVRFDRGQFFIESTDGVVRDAIQETRNLQMVPIVCVQDGISCVWQVRKVYGGRKVTLEQALWAVNGLYEQPPFEFQNGACVKVMGRESPETKYNLRAYPVMLQGSSPQVHFGVPSRELLEAPLDDKGVAFHVIDFTSDKSLATVKTEANAWQFFQQLKIWAEQNDPIAQLQLALAYARGDGVGKNEEEAAKLWRDLAEQGNARAQFDLGVCYANGDGVPKDDAEAVRWFRKAAEQGNAWAQFNLGVMYADGRGVGKDEAEAVRWYRKAAEQGDEKAKLALKRLGY
jgi:hypothetical protein